MSLMLEVTQFFWWLHGVLGVYTSIVKKESKSMNLTQAKLTVGTVSVLSRYFHHFTLSNGIQLSITYLSKQVSLLYTLGLVQRAPVHQLTIMAVLLHDPIISFLVRYVATCLNSPVSGANPCTQMKVHTLQALKPHPLSPIHCKYTISNTNITENRLNYDAWNK